jgi:microcystin degradation protein MlrC
VSRRQPRVLFAGLFHETHCFLDDTTGLDDFRIRRGKEVLAVGGDPSPLGGALESGQKFGWDVIPAIDYRAMPSGIVEDEVLDAFWKDFVAHWLTDLDAVFLVLHGAMVAESCLDVEGELLARIRSLDGAENLPVYGVYDLHANFSPAMAEHADVLVAYRENPHTDARQSAERVAGLLQKHFDTGDRARMFLHRVPIIWPPMGSGTATDPMRSLEESARRIEHSDPEIWAVNVAAGFAYADTPWTGVSFQVVATEKARLMDSRLAELAAIATELESQGRVFLPTLDDALAELRQPAEGLTVLVEPADNIGAGAPGDCTSCLRVLVEQRFDNAAIAINDPNSVEALNGVPIGGTRTLAIGGRGSRFDPGPLTLDVELIRKGSGRFTLEDKQSHLASISGNRFDMGACAVVRHQGVQILLTSNRTPPFDLGQWRSQGIEPSALSMVVVKAAVAHKAAYDPIMARTLSVETPGPCPADLTSFHYRHASGRIEMHHVDRKREGPL